MDIANLVESLSTELLY